MADRAPYFSVVTPSFNQAEFIESMIQSVLAQGTNDFEHLVYDNCSTDETCAILRRHPHLRWVSERDGGQAAALNRGFRESRGEIICWMNADDAYPPGTFAAVRAAFDANPSMEVLYGDAEEIYFDGRKSAVRKAQFERRGDFITWWERKIWLLQPAVFFRRRVFEKAGYLREDLHLILDTEFWWRLSGHATFHYLDRVLALQRLQPAAKTVSGEYRIYLEKDAVFTPLGKLLPNRSQLALQLAKRRVLGARYLRIAHGVPPENRALRAKLLGLTLKENPLLFLHPNFFGGLARLVGGAPVDRVFQRLRGGKR